MPVYFNDSKVQQIRVGVSPEAADQTPLSPSETGAAGTSEKYARADHQHPSELPSGGSAGQILTKTASGEEWASAPSGLPDGGSVGQVLTKTADGKAWVDAPVVDISGKLDKTGDGSNVTVTFSTLSKLNLVSGDSLSRLMGKISAWLKDLGKLAFKNTVDKADLASDVQTSLGKADSALQSYTETDPTVPAWAKAATKPSYTASEVGALPNTTVIPTVPATTSLLKGDGSGGIVAATRGSDYIASGNIVKQTLVNVETTPTENYAIDWLFG